MATPIELGNSLNYQNPNANVLPSPQTTTLQKNVEVPINVYIPESTTADAIRKQLLQNQLSKGESTTLRVGDVGIDLKENYFSRGDFEQGGTTSQQSPETTIENVARWFPEKLVGTNVVIDTKAPQGYKMIATIGSQPMISIQTILAEPDTSFHEPIGYVKPPSYNLAKSGEFVLIETLEGPDISKNNLTAGFRETGSDAFQKLGTFNMKIIPTPDVNIKAENLGLDVNTGSNYIGVTDKSGNIWISSDVKDNLPSVEIHEVLHNVFPQAPEDIIGAVSKGTEVGGVSTMATINVVPIITQPQSVVMPEKSIESFSITPINLTSGLPQYGTRTAEVIGTGTVVPETHTLWGQKVLDVLGIETETGIKSFKTQQTSLGMTVPTVEMKTVPIIKQEDIYGKGFVPALAKGGLVGAVETFGMSAASAPLQTGVGLIGLGVTGITQGPVEAGKEFVKGQVTFAEQVVSGDPWALGFLAGSVAYGKLGQLATVDILKSVPTLESLKTMAGEPLGIKLGTALEIEKGVKVNVGEVLSLEGMPVLKDIKLVQEFGKPKDFAPSMTQKIQSFLTGEEIKPQGKFLQLETPGADIRTVIENIGDMSRLQGEKLTFQQTFYNEKGSPVFMKTATKVGIGEGDVTLVQSVEKIGALQRTDFPDLNQNLQRIGLSSKEMFGIKEGQTLGVKSLGVTAEEIMGVSGTKLAEPIFLGEKIAGVKIKASTQQLDVFRKGVVLEDIGFQELVSKYPQSLIREEANIGGIQKLKMGSQNIILEEGILREKQFEALKGTETKTLIKEFETYRFTEPEKSFDSKVTKISPMDTQSLETLKLVKQSQLIGEEFNLLKSVREPSVTFGMLGIPVVKTGEQFRITSKPLQVPEQLTTNFEAIYDVTPPKQMPTFGVETVFIPQDMKLTTTGGGDFILPTTQVDYVLDVSSVLQPQIPTKTSRRPTQISFPIESLIPKESFNLKPQKNILPKELSIPSSMLIPSELTVAQPRETTIPAEMLIPTTKLIPKEKLIPQQILIPELIPELAPRTFPKVFAQPNYPFLPMFPMLGGGGTKSKKGKKYRRGYRYTPTLVGIESGKRLKRTPSPYVGIQVGGIRYPAKERINVPLFGSFELSQNSVRKVKSKPSKRGSNIERSLKNVFSRLGV